MAFERHEANFDILDEDGGPLLVTGGKSNEIEEEIKEQQLLLSKANRF